MRGASFAVFQRYTCTTAGCNGVPKVEGGCFSDYHLDSCVMTYTSTVHVHARVFWGGGYRDPPFHVESEVTNSLLHSRYATNNNVYRAARKKEAQAATNGNRLLGESVEFDAKAVAVAPAVRRMATDDAANATNATESVDNYIVYGTTLATSTQDSELPLCSEGASGPLCQACDEGYFMDSESQLCVECSGTSYLSNAQNLLYIVFIAFVIKTGGRIPTPKFVKKLFRMKNDFSIPGMGLMRYIDPGQAKIIWSTYQIVMGVSVGLDMSWPEPMASWQANTGFVNLSFLSTDCAAGTSFHANVYANSALPAIVVALLWLTYWIQKLHRSVLKAAGRGKSDKLERKIAQDSYSYYYSTTLATTCVPFLKCEAMETLVKDTQTILGQKQKGFRKSATWACGRLTYACSVHAH